VFAKYIHFEKIILILYIICTIIINCINSSSSSSTSDVIIIIILYQTVYESVVSKSDLIILVKNAMNINH